MSDQPDVGTSTTDNTQHSQETHIRASGEARTLNPSKRLAADPRLRPRQSYLMPIINSAFVLALDVFERPTPSLTLYHSCI